MAVFTDCLGREWDLRVTVADLEPLRRLAGLDLSGLSAAVGHAGGLISDPEKLVRVLYHLCSEQAKSQDVSPEAFGRGFAGMILVESARALMEAIVDFFPLPPESGANLKESLKAILHGESKASTIS